MLEEKTGVRSTSLDIVRKYAEGTIGTFTKRDVMTACPSLGSSSVKSALKKLVEDGTLGRLGSDRKNSMQRMTNDIERLIERKIYDVCSAGTGWLLYGDGLSDDQNICE